jgi:hypothetical protein
MYCALRGGVSLRRRRNDREVSATRSVGFYLELFMQTMKRKGRLVFKETAYRIWTVVVDGKCLWSILQNDFNGRFHLFYRDEYRDHFRTLGEAKKRANLLHLGQ